jgi:hypothetical protein
MFFGGTLGIRHLKLTDQARRREGRLSRSGCLWRRRGRGNRGRLLSPEHLRGATEGERTQHHEEP